MIENTDERWKRKMRRDKRLNNTKVKRNLEEWGKEAEIELGEKKYKVLGIA